MQGCDNGSLCSGQLQNPHTMWIVWRPNHGENREQSKISLSKRSRIYSMNEICWNNCIAVYYCLCLLQIFSLSNEYIIFLMNIVFGVIAGEKIGWKKNFPSHCSLLEMFCFLSIQYYRITCGYTMFRWPFCPNRFYVHIYRLFSRTWVVLGF